MQEKSLNFGLALAPKLKPKLLDSRNHFTNMKVSSATNVINHAVSSALTLIAKETNNSDFITTAWFNGYVSKWFKLMSSRNPKSALGKLHIEKFENAITFLEEFIELIATMKVGKSCAWKPFQTGIVISTTSIIQTTKYLLDDHNFKFILGSHFMQDCIENLFSVIRSKHVSPTAVQFKNDLKLITISFYMKNVSHGSYEQDDREFFSEFLDILANNKRKINKSNETSQEIPNELTVENIEFNNITLDRKSVV